VGERGDALARRWAGPLVVVAPHPDDESLGVGGAIARALASGRDVRVICVTDGEAAFGDRRRSARAKLASRRRDEQGAALAILRGDGPGDVELVRLGLPDGAVAAHERELTVALERLIVGADEVLAPHRHDGHPDHESCARAAVMAAGAGDGGRRPAFGEYVIWGWHRPSRPLRWERARRVQLDDVTYSRKWAAIEVHRSQLDSPPGRAAVLPPEVMAPFRSRAEVVFV
jgi:LmbE family N-acetylglucosaminyl deacetylase